jgi:hypothetical protein
MWIAKLDDEKYNVLGRLNNTFVDDLEENQLDELKYWYTSD